MTDMKDAPLTEEELAIADEISERMLEKMVSACIDKLVERMPTTTTQSLLLYRLISEARRLRTFERFVLKHIHECPEHGFATEKYPCPDACPWRRL
jgi:hypothetical protein